MEYFDKNIQNLNGDGVVNYLHLIFSLNLKNIFITKREANYKAVDKGKQTFAEIKDNPEFVKYFFISRIRH